MPEPKSLFHKHWSSAYNLSACPLVASARNPVAASPIGAEAPPPRGTAMTFVPFVGRGTDWLALAVGLQRRDEARLADFIRAGLAFGAPDRDSVSVTLGITGRPRPSSGP